MGYVLNNLELVESPAAVESVAPPTGEEIALVERVLGAFEVRDPAAAAHVRRMSAVAGLLAERVGMEPSQASMARAASSLHDIGKLTVSAAVLWKRGGLTDDERRAVERHTITGYEILRQVEAPTFRLAATIALTHHERWDGEGYPFGLSGTEIPLLGRIAAVADVFDALLSERPYRPGLELDQALATLRDGRGTHFDPAVIDALFSDLDGALAVRR
jgi:two-component system, response regulator RpfG